MGFGEGQEVERDRKDIHDANDATDATVLRAYLRRQVFQLCRTPKLVESDLGVCLWDIKHTIALLLMFSRRCGRNDLSKLPS